jgi:hypothetical protein
MSTLFRLNLSFVFLALSLFSPMTFLRRSTFCWWANRLFWIEAVGAFRPDQIIEQTPATATPVGAHSYLLGLEGRGEVILYRLTCNPLFYRSRSGGKVYV